MEIAVVTGGSSGIGLAISKKLSETHQVWNLSRSAGFDVTSPWDVSFLFSEIVKFHGIPSVLVNCAGFVEPKGLLEITDEEWYQTINTNLSGTFFCTREFVKHAKNVGGKIINIASTAGMRAQPGWSAYAAAKAAVINFSATMSEELSPYGIKVYCLSPGRCATALRKKLAPDEDQTSIMQPEDVADIVSFLVDNGDLIDGQNIRVRGV